VLGGPTFLVQDNDTSVSPGVTAALTQAFKWGTVSVGYDQAITAETVGTTDRKAIFASILAPTLMRGLQLEFTPRYAIADEENPRGGTSDTIKTLTLTLRATYQIARSISVIGSYTFYRQTSDQDRNDIDQNRVFLGFQYAFPINFY